MCYGYNRDFGWDVRKDAAREPEERPEPRGEAKEPKSWAFSRDSREFPGQEPEAAPAGRVREKV